MIAVDRLKASECSHLAPFGCLRQAQAPSLSRGAHGRSRDEFSSPGARGVHYFPLRFLAAGRFLRADLGVFLGDFFARLAADFLPFFVLVETVVDRPPLKILSQLSEYCFVAPTRTTLIAEDAPV